MDWARTGVTSFGHQFDFMTSSITYTLATLTIDSATLLLQLMDIQNVHKNTVELWSLELACLEHQGSLKLVRRSLQFPYTLNVKIHPRLEQQWLELSNSKHSPQGDFSCKNAMMARIKYLFT